MAHEGLSGAGLVSQATAGGNTATNQLTFSRGSIKYDSPFLDMTSTFIPKHIKSILKFVAAYVLGDGLVSQCVSKMSEYPITKFIYNDEEKSSIRDDKSIDFWKNLLEDKLDIARILKQCGMDYYAYGNSIISISYPFRRVLECPRCKKRHSAESIEATFKNYKFEAKCMGSKCGYSGPMNAFDQDTKEIDKVKIVHWDLMCIDIKYNSITGDHFYYYTVPSDLRSAIQRGDMDIINSTRLEIIEAIKKRKQLKLMADNVYHMKRPAPQYIIPSQRGWGIPVIMPVMKDIFHNKILKKGNEMIAFDHIVPLRIMFPMGTGDVSPHLTTNLSGWKNRIEEELAKWRKDPNRISIVPMPIGTENFSGDSKMLMVTQEIKATEDAIITGIGIIPEVIRGGASWSGSNVSLRIVENTFLNHRNDIKKVMDFIVERISLYFRKPKVDVKMSDFKMADDLEKKKLVINAAKGSPSEALISRTTVTKELGFDVDQEYDNRSEELKKIIEMKIEEAEGAAEANGAASILGALYQADSEMENAKRREKHERETQGERDEENQIQKEENTASVQEDAKQVGEERISLPKLILILTSRFARLAKINRDEFKIRMLAMKNSMPSMYNEIYNNLKEMNLIEADILPDLAVSQKYTPGQIPTNAQGDTLASEVPNPVEAGAPVPSEVLKQKPLPEVRPPISSSAPI